MDPLNTKRLAYFVQIAELGSFSKAASVLGIAQPALSRHIRMLESELDLPLFYRNGRGVSVTEAGAELLRRGKPILEQLGRLRTDILEMGGQPVGLVILGVPPTLSLVLVTPLVTQCRKRSPKVRLEVIEGLSGHVKEWLINGRLDIAILYDAPRTRNVLADRLLEEDLFLVCPAGAPVGADGVVPVAKLAGLPFILPRRPHGLRLLVESIAARQGVEIRVDYEMDALPVMREMVVEGNAYTILPSAAVYDLVADGRLVLNRLVDPPVTRTLVLATSTQRPLSLAARALIDLIKKEVAELVASGKWSGAEPS